MRIYMQVMGTGSDFSASLMEGLGAAVIHGIAAVLGHCLTLPFSSTWHPGPPLAQHSAPYGP